MEVFSAIIQRLEPRVPAGLLADPHARQRALLTLGTSYVFAAVALALVPFVETEAEGVARLLPRFNVIASAGLVLLTGPLLRRSESLLVAGNWMTGLLYVGLWFAVLVGGLLESPFWISPMLLPLLATALAGRASGIAWGVAVLALYGGVYGLSVAGVELADLTAPGSRDQLTLLAALASTIVLTAIVVLADATHRDVIGRMQTALDALERAIVERERAQVRAHEAVAANTAKSAFLATMSHELRTPLNAIIGYTELLLEDAEDRARARPGPAQAPGEELDDLRRIRGAGEHLLNLISDVLDISRIEAARLDMSPEPIEPAALLEEVAALLAPLASKRGNELRTAIEGPLPTLHLDRARVRQVLVNVLGNALKFTERGLVELRARSGRASDGSEGVTIEIADTGIGIPEEKLAQIFQPFTQVDPSRTREYEGTGLGLAICGRLLEMMSGTISVRSRLGEGSTFTIELPAPRAVDGTSEAAEARAPTPEKPRRAAS